MERYLRGRGATSSLRVLRLRGGRGGVSFRVRRWVWAWVLVVVEHLLESVEVEGVADVLLVDLAEELVVFEVAEPADPAVALLRAVGVAL